VSPVSVTSIGEYIRQQREQAKISLRQLASAAGVSNPYLSQVERGLRRPSAEILQQIAKGLRISAEALYVQAGILEDRRPDSGVRSAVLVDPDLTERQKQVLLEIYESFRRETALNAGASVSAEAAAAGAASPGPDLGSGSPEPARAGAGVRRRTGSTRTGSTRTGSTGTGSTGTGSTGSTGAAPGAGLAAATGQAADSAHGAGGRPGGTGRADGTDKESAGAEAPVHDGKGLPTRQARKGEIHK
jgi:transcriptional regulator with XRE-family HTH domain